jgi:hypothetical protein
MVSIGEESSLGARHWALATALVPRRWCIALLLVPPGGNLFYS